MRGDKLVLLYSLGFRDSSLGSLYDLKAVFNGREVPVDDKSIPRRLRAGSALVLGVNIEDQSSRSASGIGDGSQLYQSDPVRWQKIMVSLNKALHHLYENLGTNGIRLVELIITCAGATPPDVHRALCGCLSPALATAASVPVSTASLGDDWYGPNAVDIPLLRTLFPLVRRLREEALLFNKLYTQLIREPEAWEECTVIDGEFELRKAPGGLVSRWLHHPSRLQKDIIFARSWLEESDYSEIDEAIGQCVSDCERLQALQTIRKEDAEEAEEQS